MSKVIENYHLRLYAGLKGVTMCEIAKAWGLTDEALSKMMAEPLTEANVAKFRDIVDGIVAKRKEDQ